MRCIQTFGEDELSRSHPTFLWVLKASRNWSLLKELIPDMTEYIKAHPTARRYRPTYHSSNRRNDAGDLSLNFAPVFKQLFCIAAQRLADHIHEPLEQLGTLFEEPLETGALSLYNPSRSALTHRVTPPFKEMEGEGGQHSPRGKYLFLTRQLGIEDTSKFASLGYRFAVVAQIAEPMSKRMQINRDALVARMKRMQISASPEHLPPRGVHLACFMLRPSICKSFDVLVPEFVQNQVPYITLQSNELSPEQSRQFGHVLDELSVIDVLAILLDRSRSLEMDDDIRSRLLQALQQLIEFVGDADALLQAKFSARPIHVPCQPHSDLTLPPTCTFFTVRTMRDVHASSAKKEMVYVPLCAFSVQQHYEILGWQDEHFAREVKAEFGHLLQSRAGPKRPGFDSIRLGRMLTSPRHRLHGPGSTRSTIRESLAGGSHQSRGRQIDVAMSDYKIDQSKRLDRTATAAASPVATPEGGSSRDEARTLRRPHGRGSIPATLREGDWVTELLGLFQIGTESWRSVRSGARGWDSHVRIISESGREESYRED